MHNDDVAGKFRQRQYLNAVEWMSLVAGSVSPVHPGIDRYLDSAARSRGMLQKVNRNSPAFA